MARAPSATRVPRLASPATPPEVVSFGLLARAARLWFAGSVRPGGERFGAGGTTGMAAAALGWRIVRRASLCEAQATTVARKEARTETPADMLLLWGREMQGGGVLSRRVSDFL